MNNAGLDSWMDRLKAQYPVSDSDEEDDCSICAEENGLCQLAAETIVTDVAWECDATEEDVARWVVLNDIDLVRQSISDLAEQYNASLEQCEGTGKEPHPLVRYYEARVAELEAALKAAQPAAQWEPVPDGVYVFDGDTDDQVTWSMSGGGVEITDCIGDWVTVDMPPGWCIMRTVITEAEKTNDTDA